MRKRYFLSARCGYRRILRLLSDKRALSDVISATMMAGAVLTLSIVVFVWSQNVSSNYNNQFSQSVGAEVDRLKEKLVFEHVLNITSNKIRAYLLNCGTIDNVGIKTVYIINSNNVVIGTFSNTTFTLKFLNDTSIPDKDLDKGEEGYIDLSPISLIHKAYYSIRIVTWRGATFDSSFVA